MRHKIPFRTGELSVDNLGLEIDSRRRGEPEATGLVDRHGRLALTVLSVRSATGDQHYVPRFLCAPVPMFPEPMFPGT